MRNRIRIGQVDTDPAAVRLERTALRDGHEAARGIYRKCIFFPEIRNVIAAARIQIAALQADGGERVAICHFDRRCLYAVIAVHGDAGEVPLRRFRGTGIFICAVFADVPVESHVITIIKVCAGARVGVGVVCDVVVVVDGEIEIGVGNDVSAAERRIAAFVEIHVAVDGDVRFPVRRRAAVRDSGDDDGHGDRGRARHIGIAAPRSVIDREGTGLRNACARGRRPAVSRGRGIFRGMLRAAARQFFAVTGAAFKESRCDGDGAAVNVEHAADGVIKAAAPFGVDDGEADALGDVEHGLAVVALQFIAVEVDGQVGIDVGRAARDDERVVDIVGDLDVRVTVFDGVEKFVHRGDDHVVRHGIDQFAVISAVRFLLGGVSRRREGKAHQGDDEQAQKDADGNSLLLFVHAAPPSAEVPMPATSDLCTKSTVSCVWYLRLSDS